MAAHKRLQRRVLFVATTHHHTWWFQLVQRPQQSNNSVVKREIQCLKYPNALILTPECYWHERSSHFKMNGRWRRRAETQKKVNRSREAQPRREKSNHSTFYHSLSIVEWFSLFFSFFQSDCWSCLPKWSCQVAQAQVCSRFQAFCALCGIFGVHCWRVDEERRVKSMLSWSSIVRFSIIVLIDDHDG